MTATRANLLDTSIPGAKASSQPFFCNKESDTIFHLSPFVQLHVNTIFLIHANLNPENNHPGFVKCASGSSDNVPKNQSCQVSLHLASLSGKC